MGVYPNVHVAPGWLHVACELRIIQCHLSQHSLWAAAILRHPIIPGAVDVHRPVAGDLGVYHHVVRVPDATCARQLCGQDGQKENFKTVFKVVTAVNES